ncbi:MAG: hypothetical protein COA57_08395 [Flavobacteriales bacterium]|nr:TonB-dependent receptor [Bacteroidales bacterium AH-315-I05]PCJ84928.1 MAG: hypothetical protein COA57_08395 [Flavobacteriales bacterium]
MRTLFLSCMIVMLLFPSLILAQEMATIKGNIIDGGTKETLIGVNVVLEDNTGVASDFNGNYELKVLPGQHTILYRFIGYTPQTKTVDVQEGQEITINVVLEETITELQVVVVSAGKFEQRIEDVTVSMEVIKPSLVENKATTNMETVVNQVPGVQIVDSEPQIRGGSGYSFGAGSRVQILVDDLPALNGDAGRPKWSFLPIENLEQIEILKGASSVLYGSAALSGVINIRTAYPKDKPITKVNVNTGIYDNPTRKNAIYWGKSNPIYTGMNFFHSRKIGNLDLVIGGNVFKDQGYIGPAPEDVVVKKPGSTITLIHPTLKDTIIVSGTGSDTLYRHIATNEGEFEKRARANVNLRYRPKNIEGLSFGMNFNGMYSESSGALIMLDADTGMYRSFPGAITRTLATNYNVDPFLNYYSKQGDRVMVRTRLYYEDNNNNNNQANKSVFYYTELQYAKKFQNIKDFNVTVGVVNTFAESEAELYEGNEDSTGISSAMNNAAYVQLDKKFWERLTISGGARYERFVVNEIEDAQPVFRFGMSGRVLKATYLRGSWGQGFRVPTIAERYILTSVGAMNIFPNPTLKPEKSWNAEVGIKQGFKILDFMGYLDVAAFRQEVEDAVEFNFGFWGTQGTISQNLGFKSINTGRARIEGVDISLVGQGKLGPIEVNILTGYTFINPVALTPLDTVSNDSIFFLNTFTGEVVNSGTTNPVTYKNSSQDTSGILKYRFEHMIKADVEFSYKKYSLGVSYRFLSYMKNVDKVFIDLDENSGEPLQGTLPTGIKKYREEHDGKGDYVFDLRASYRANDNVKVALIINNLLNREYMVRPLTIESPRTFALQFTMNF